MKKVLAAAMLLPALGLAFAQEGAPMTEMEYNIQVVKQKQLENEARARARMAEQQAAQAEAQKRAQAQKAQANRERAARDAQKQKVAAERQAKLDRYADEERELELELKRLEVEAKRAQVENSTALDRARAENARDMAQLELDAKRAQIKDVREEITREETAASYVPAESGTVRSSGSSIRRTSGSGI